MVFPERPELRAWLVISLSSLWISEKNASRNTCHMNIRYLRRSRSVQFTKAFSSFRDPWIRKPIRDIGQSPSDAPRSEKKADVIEHSEVFDHVGLLVNGPLGTAGAPFI